MPLPTVALDDRRFQDIVDQAKALIPQYCPEWTDHNVSDPGVALIELFAWMTDMLLYRVNQTPDKMYVTFLDLIGAKLEPPRAARAPVTFYLSAPQPSEVTIAEGTEVATVRTESASAVTFTTERDLVVRPPALAGAFTRDIDRSDEGSWAEHDLAQMDLPGQRMAIFAGSPNPGDAFYLAFRGDHSHHVLALIIRCGVARGAGVDPTDPPVVWEAWQGGATRWAECEVESDGTGGFNWPGEVVLHVPAMARVAFRDVSGYWLRCRMTAAKRPGTSTYEVSPEIEQLRVEARGGTAPARHAVTTRDEPLGRSDGTPGQRFALLQTPVLARDAGRDYLTVEPPGGAPERWEEVEDFGDSGPGDRHFTLDAADGTVALGPSLLQPDGSVYRFGAVPPKGSALRFARYQSGGGVAGNVPAATLSVLKSGIPYVARVTNRGPAAGGRDAQSLDDAKLRAPRTLRTRTRAVTADDFETLARQVPGVERACCLAPGAQPGAPGAPRPGEVHLAVLPQGDEVGGYVAPDRLLLSAELMQAVEAHLNQRRLVGTRLVVRSPQLVWVSVTAAVRLPERAGAAHAGEVRRQAEAALYRYLNPYVGGPGGGGWPFGRELHVSELYALLQRLPGLEFVDELRLEVADAAPADGPGGDGGAPRRAAPPRLVIPPGALICSHVHRVNRA
jgi:predicted phage baseplate assembly protein